MNVPTSHLYIVFNFNQLWASRVNKIIYIWSGLTTPIRTNCWQK